MGIQKIQIVGGAGSGKTFLAELLAKKLHISHHDLDNLFWDNSTNNYNKKRDPAERNMMLLKILQDNSWVMEGVFYSWLQDAFANADLIIVLKTSLFTRQFRIVKRFICRKLGWSPVNKQDTWQGLIALLKWNGKFDQRQMPEIINMTNPYSAKRIVIGNKRELRKMINAL